MTAAHSQRVIICFAGVYLPCTPQVSFLIPLQCNGLSDVNTSKFDDQSIFRMALLIMEYSFEILVLEEKKAKSKIHKSGSTGHITFSENAASFLNETKPENLNFSVLNLINILGTFELEDFLCHFDCMQGFSIECSRNVYHYLEKVCKQPGRPAGTGSSFFPTPFF